MKKKECMEIARSYGLAPNRRLGQNFLVDEGITEKIISIVSPERGDSILEIGPGMGALTAHLCERAGSVTVVEIDAGLARYLEDAYGSRPNFTLLHSDFLKCRPGDEFTKIVSNLPYYCASEILFRIAASFSARGIFVMLQREMAMRITAAPGSPEYGALTVTLGYYYNPRIMLQVPGEVFYPRPDVGSSFLRLERRSEQILSKEEAALFHDVVKSSFWGRRKTILKALSQSPHMSFEKDAIREALASAGVPESARGEELDTGTYCAIAKRLFTLPAGSGK
jgi:16S rRNA (adenine1518-N6/adenine1519-N6)-dimethyltransferase